MAQCSGRLASAHMQEAASMRLASEAAFDCFWDIVVDK